MDDANKEKSMFNEGGLQIMRLHNYWIKAETYAIKGNFKKWMWMLDVIWRELIADVERQDDNEEIKILNKKLNESIYKHFNNRNVYFLLNKRHEFLKVLQDKCGKGSKYVSDDDGFE